MTRTARVIGGFANGSAHMVAATVAGLWLTPFLLGTLGQTTFGLWLVGTQVIAYLLLLDLGIVAILPREIAYVTGRGAAVATELRTLVERTYTLACLQTPLVIAAAGVILLCMPDAWTPLRLPLAIALGVFALTFPLRVFPAILTGLQDLTFVARVQCAAWVAGTLLNVGLVLGGLGLPALAAGWCTTQILVVVCCGVRVATRFPEAMPRAIVFGGRAGIRRYAARSGWVSINQISQVLLNGTDVLIVGAVLGPAAVVPYACTGKLIAVLANQPQAILQSAAPALSELRASGDRARVFNVTAALAQATLAVSGLVACLVLALNGAFVAWWVGASQFGGTGLTVLLVAAMVVRHFNTTNIYTLFCCGRERRLALAALADGLVTLVLGAALVPAVGPAGAPLASIAGVLLVSLPLNLSAVAAETASSRLRLVTTLGPFLLRFGAIASATAALGLWVRPPSVPLLALAAALVTALYASAVTPAVLASPAGAYLHPYVDRLWASLIPWPRKRDLPVVP